MSTIRYKLDNFFLKPFYNQFINTLFQETKDCNSLLDIGCGFNLPIKKVTSRMVQSVGLDVFEPSLEKAKTHSTHSEFVLEDVKVYLEKMPDKSFDCVMALDLIEHLEKNQGYWLIEQMERLSRKKVILFTPNGFVPQRPYDNNPWQEHVSGWSMEEMKEKGFSIFGFGGYKNWRGERFSIIKKPRIFWKYVSFYSQIYFYRSPIKAYSILCVKRM